MAKVIGRARDVVGMMKDGSLIPLNLTISEQVMGNQVRVIWLFVCLAHGL